MATPEPVQSQFRLDNIALVDALRLTLAGIIQMRRGSHWARLLGVSRYVLYEFCRTGKGLGQPKIGNLYVIFVEQCAILRADDLDRAAIATGSPLAVKLRLPNTTNTPDLVKTPTQAVHEPRAPRPVQRKPEAWESILPRAEGDLSADDRARLLRQLHEFWELYPNKLKYALVQRLYLNGLRPSAAQHAEMMKALRHQVSYREHYKNSGEFIPAPCSPDRWFLDERWRDEMKDMNPPERGMMADDWEDIGPDIERFRRNNPEAAQFHNYVPDDSAPEPEAMAMLSNMFKEVLAGAPLDAPAPIPPAPPEQSPISATRFETTENDLEGHIPIEKVYAAFGINETPSYDDILRVRSGKRTWEEIETERQCRRMGLEAPDFDAIHAAAEQARRSA